MIMEIGTTLQAQACSAAQTFKTFQSVESRQRKPTNEQTKKETDGRTRALRWVTSQRATLNHSVSSKESIHMTHRWWRRGHANPVSLRGSFRQRGHASHWCALRADLRVSSAPALYRRVSLFCVTWKSWSQWNGGNRSKIILFKAVRLIDLSGWRRAPSWKGNCFQRMWLWGAPWTEPALAQFEHDTILGWHLLPQAVQYQLGLSETGSSWSESQASLRRFTDRLWNKSDQETRTSNVQKRLMWPARFQPSSKNVFWRGANCLLLNCSPLSRVTVSHRSAFQFCWPDICFRRCPDASSCQRHASFARPLAAHLFQQKLWKKNTQNVFTTKTLRLPRRRGLGLSGYHYRNWEAPYLFALQDFAAPARKLMVMLVALGGGLVPHNPCVSARRCPGLRKRRRSRRWWAARRSHGPDRHTHLLHWWSRTHRQRVSFPAFAGQPLADQAATKHCTRTTPPLNKLILRRAVCGRRESCSFVKWNGVWRPDTQSRVRFWSPRLSRRMHRQVEGVTRMFEINIPSTKEAQQTTPTRCSQIRYWCCHAKCRSPCRVGVDANTFAERCAKLLRTKGSTPACARMSACFKQHRTCVRSRTWTARVATRPRRCMFSNSVKAWRRSRRETDTTIMTRVIELLYFRKTVNVFVDHDARRVGGMKKRQTPMTRSYQIPEVAQERSCFKNLCQKTPPKTLLSVEATLVSCLEGNFSVYSRMDQPVVRRWEEERREQRGKLGPLQRKKFALKPSKEQRASWLPAIERWRFGSRPCILTWKIVLWPAVRCLFDGTHRRRVRSTIHCASWRYLISFWYHGSEGHNKHNACRDVSKNRERQRR